MEKQKGVFAFLIKMKCAWIYSRAKAEWTSKIRTSVIRTASQRQIFLEHIRTENYSLFYFKTRVILYKVL